MGGAGPYWAGVVLPWNTNTWDAKLVHRMVRIRAGLVLATGLVVDDAITVVEDTSAKKAEGMTSVQAAMESGQAAVTPVLHALGTGGEVALSTKLPELVQCAIL